jgi:hypothetical protein
MTDIREALAELLLATSPMGSTSVEDWRRAWDKGRAALAAPVAQPLFQIEITADMGARLVFNESHHLFPGQRFDCYRSKP